MDIHTEYETLSLEQKYAFVKFQNGGNLFITGPGGTGKTRFIQFLVSYMKLTVKPYQVCALTGCAAVLLNCNAKTIHSWSGIKLAKGAHEQIVNRVIRNKQLGKTWRSIQVLIVDEVSMMSYKMFTLLDEIGRITRRSSLPFGGIQLVFTGDFFQLPPIPDAGDPYSAAFCFESPKWLSTFPKENCIELRTVFRQTDPLYIEILKQVRKGYIDVEYADVLEKRVKHKYNPEENGGCVPTKLFPVRSRVEAVNNYMFSQLDGMEYTYEYSRCTNNLTYLESGKLISVEDTIRCNSLTPAEIDSETETLLSTIQTAKTISLKKGAAVMCTINLSVEDGICNGSQGTIIDFVASYTPNQPSIMVPLVRFSNGKVMRVSPFHRQSEDFPAISVCQIPLCLAWALTIHKIQGASLHMAEIDIGKTIFEYGQTYVALSRICSLDGLFISEFYPHRIKANPAVIAFYDSFSQMTSAEMEQYIAQHRTPIVAGTIPERNIQIENGKISGVTPSVFRIEDTAKISTITGTTKIIKL
jgi:ATP-dependent DNA helicase PIF1